MALRDVLDRARSNPGTGSEEGAKVQIVLPILGALGWDFTDPKQMEFEYTVGTRRQRGQVDIVLRGARGGNVALIEAKAPGKNLNEFVEQLMEYAFNDSAGICVLTTGFLWWFYLPRADGTPSERRFAVLDIKEDPIEQLADDFETYLSRSALLDRSAHSRAQQALEAGRKAELLLTEIPQVWNKMLQEPDHDLIQLIEQRVFRAVRLRPSPEQIAAVLRGDAPLPTLSPAPSPSPPLGPRSSRRRPTSIKATAMDYLQSRAPDSVHINDILTHLQSLNRAPTGQSPRTSLNTTLYRVAKDGEIEAVGRGLWRATRAQSGVRRSTPKRGKRQASRRITGYRLWGIDHETNMWKSMLGGVAAEVYRKHPDEFHRALSLRGRSWQYVATNPDNMRRPVSIPNSSYFIETSANGSRATQLARQLLTMFGHEADDLEILYD